jgi:hypothetical protein
MIGTKTTTAMKDLSGELIDAYRKEIKEAFLKSDEGLKVSLNLAIIPSKTRPEGVDVDATISFTAERIKEKREKNGIVEGQGELF